MDKDQVAEMVRKGSTAAGVVQIQTLAKADMQKAHYGFTLHNACAATLSEFMISSLINVPVTLGVTDLARRIAARGWVRINVGDQQAGDVAVAESDVHIFLVLKAIDRDMMLIADNQRPYPHERKASGQLALNFSPIAYFLRANGAAAPTIAIEDHEPHEMNEAARVAAEFPQGDEDTNHLVEPFQDDGQPAQ